MESALKDLYRAHTGHTPHSVEELPSSGSNRRYFRLSAPGCPTLVGVLGTIVQENDAFLSFDEHFASKQLPVPRVVAVAPDRMSYLQTDLGDTLLFHAIEKGRLTRVFSPEERELALHQGPARPWLMGFYAEAYLKVFGMSGVGYIDRMLIGFEDEMTEGCIASLSQLYDGNPPFRGRGAVSHATNVAEVLRTVRLIKRFSN